MIRSVLKVTLVTIFLCLLNCVAKAQIGFNYDQWDIGVAGAYNSVKSDAAPSTGTASVNFSLNFNQTPYLNYIFEVQAGKLEGGIGNADTTTGRQFSNSFTAFVFRIQIQAGEIMDYSESPFKNALKNFYVSPGLGYLVNNVKTNSYSLTSTNGYVLGHAYSTEIFLPLRIGYEFKLFNSFKEPSVKIDLGYEYNYIFGDGLDGFSLGKGNNAYSQFTLGVKFAIGSKTSYRKQIYY
jgi:hypothetical protein